jgi:FAS-associated factor 2
MDDLPRFKGTHPTAVAEARKRAKYLLTFLHSPGHPDSRAFRNRILNDHSVLGVLRSDFLLWEGFVNEEPGYRLSFQLQATTFPFVAVQLKGDTVATIQGDFTQADFLSFLHTTMSTTESTRADEISWAADRESREQLRGMQERELAEAEAIDFQRQEDSRIRAAEELAVKRAAEEEERLQREEQERIKAEQEERVRMVELTKAMALSSLPDESDSVQGVDPAHIATLRMISLNGTANERQWPFTAPIEHLYAFARAQVEYDGRPFYLSSGFPPKRLPAADGSTVGDHKGLIPRAVVKMHEQLQ